MLRSISYIALFFSFSSLCLNAQLITNKNGKYGLINAKTGDIVLEQKYDTIYALPFDKHISQTEGPESNSPLYACLLNNEFHIYNSTTATFHSNTYDEIRFIHEDDERYRPYPAKYNPNHIDCITLHKGKYWGYIAHSKSYGFHDKLTKDDKFDFIEPIYDYLTTVEEENGYTGHEFASKKRIMIALKDSLYGALDFKTGKVIVPIRYKYPISDYWNRYDRRGIEFLSTEGGFIKYYIARKNYDSKKQTIINANGFDVSFDLDYNYTLDIFSEYSKQYLYVKSKDKPKQTLTIWDYNLGDLLLQHTCDSTYEITETRRSEFILAISAYSREFNRYQITWYNVLNKQVILYHEDKLKFGFEQFFVPVIQNGEQVIYYKKPTNIIGTIVGRGSDLHIEWKKKVYLRDQTKK